MIISRSIRLKLEDNSDYSPAILETIGWDAAILGLKNRQANIDDQVTVSGVLDPAIGGIFRRNGTHATQFAYQCQLVDYDDFWVYYGDGCVTWTPGQFYTYGTIAVDNGVRYICFLHHDPSSASNRPGSGANWQNYWVTYDSTFADWQISTVYSVRDIKKVDGTKYICISAHTSDSVSPWVNKPGIGSNWQTFWRLPIPCQWILGQDMGDLSANVPQWYAAGKTGTYYPNESASGLAIIDCNLDSFGQLSFTEKKPGGGQFQPPFTTGIALQAGKVYSVQPEADIQEVLVKTARAGTLYSAPPALPGNIAIAKDGSGLQPYGHFTLDSLHDDLNIGAILIDRNGNRIAYVSGSASGQMTIKQPWVYFSGGGRFLLKRTGMYKILSSHWLGGSPSWSYLCLVRPCNFGYALPDWYLSDEIILFDSEGYLVTIMSGVITKLDPDTKSNLWTISGLSGGKIALDSSDNIVVGGNLCYDGTATPWASGGTHYNVGDDVWNGADQNPDIHYRCILDHDSDPELLWAVGVSYSMGDERVVYWVDDDGWAKLRCVVPHISSSENVPIEAPGGDYNQGWNYWEWIDEWDGWQTRPPNNTYWELSNWDWRKFDGDGKRISQFALNRSPIQLEQAPDLTIWFTMVAYRISFSDTPGDNGYMVPTGQVYNGHLMYSMTVNGTTWYLYYFFLDWVITTLTPSQYESRLWTSDTAWNDYLRAGYPTISIIVEEGTYYWIYFPGQPGQHLMSFGSRGYEATVNGVTWRLFNYILIGGVGKWCVTKVDPTEPIWTLGSGGPAGTYTRPSYGNIIIAEATVYFEMNPEDLTVSDIHTDIVPPSQNIFKIDSQGCIYIFSVRIEYQTGQWATLRKFDSSFNLIWAADIPLAQGVGKSFQFTIDKELNDDIYISSTGNDGYVYSPVHYKGPMKISSENGDVVWDLKNILGNINKWRPGWDYIYVQGSSRGVINLTGVLVSPFRESSVWD